MMKHLLTVTAILLLALPLAAEEKDKKKAEETRKRSASAQPEVDSPLVAAAKRARRGAGKSVVITDETVKNATGHVTSTTIVYSPKLPETIEPSVEVITNEKRAKERADNEKAADDAKAAAKKQHAEAAKRARMAEAMEEYEDGYDDGVDPAEVERSLAEEAKKAEKPQ